MAVAEVAPREATSDTYSVKLYRVRLYRELPGARQAEEADNEESGEPGVSRLRRRTHRWW